MSLSTVSQQSNPGGWYVRIRLLGDGEEMGRLLGPRLAGVDLDHSRDVERVDLGKRVCRDEDYARVRVDLLLSISEFDGLEDCGESAGGSRTAATEVVPAGSFRCDRLVRSSLASSMAGFISGGSFDVHGSPWRESTVVSIVLVCKIRQYRRHEQL
jgi:hypothetical protein